MPSTESRFFRSTGAAAFSQIWRIGVMFLTELVLRRYVADEDWGIFDWTFTVFLILGAARDLGLLYHVVRIKPRPYGNLLALELIWGGVLAATVALGAPMLARLAPNSAPDLPLVIAAFAVYLFLEGLASVPKTFFENELAVGRLVLPEVLRNLIAAGSAIAMAIAGLGVWSLVLSQVLAVAVYCAHLWLLARGRIELLWLRGKTWSLVQHSLPLALIWLLVILTRYIDPLLLRWFAGDAVVGNYGFAYKYAFFVSVHLIPAFTRALYPALVEFRDQRHKLVESYRLATLAVMAVEIPAACFLLLNPELFVRIVSGPQWPSAPQFLMILALAPLLDPFTRLGGELLKTVHRERLWIASAIATLTGFAVGGVLLIRWLGPTGMAWANYLPFGMLLMAWAIWKVDAPAFRDLLRDLAWMYAVPMIPFALCWWLLADRPWLRLAVSIALSGLTLGVYWRRFGKDFKAFLAASGKGEAPPDQVVG